MIDTIDDDVLLVPVEKRLDIEELVVMIMNFGCVCNDDYDDMVSSLIGKGSYTYAPKKLDLDSKNRATPPVRPSI